MISDYIANFAKYLKIQARSPATVESYCRDAQHFLHWLQESKVDLQQVQSEYLIEYQQHLEHQGIRKNSCRRRIIGIRQFFRFLEDQRLIAASPFDVVPIPDRINKLPAPLTEGELVALIKAADQQAYTIKAKRDVVILHLLAFEGLKTNEIINLERSSILFDQTLLLLSIGGQHQRQILCSPPSQDAIHKFLTTLDALEEEEGSVSSKLFMGFKGQGNSAPHGQLTRHGLKFLLYELGHTVGIDALNAEMLRHFAIDHMRRSGFAPHEIMAHLGLKQLGIIAQHFHSSQELKISSPVTTREEADRVF